MIKRKVFFVSGYDPRGAGFYHGLMDRQTKRWSQISGKQVAISSRKRVSEVETSYQLETDAVQIDYSFLHWDDLIRKTWNRTIFKFLNLSVRAHIYYFKHADWPMFKKYSKGLELGYKMPIKILASFLLFSIILLVGMLLSESFILTFFLLPTFFFIAVALAVYCFKKYNLIWLIRAFEAGYTIIILNAVDWRKRIKSWVNIMLEDDLDSYDEVWLISHSHGTLLTPFLLSELNKVSNAKVKMITLGTLSPFYLLLNDFLPGREVLAELSQEDIEWFDISSPADPASFPLVSPFGIDVEHKAKLYLHSPKFHKAYGESSYKKLKANKLALHFSYLEIPEYLGYPNFIESMLSAEGLNTLR